VATDEIIQQIKEQADIVAVVGRYVDLRKRGRNFVGLCPFHSEKTPSFTVSAEKDLFHCFGCGKGGDILAFVMEIEGVDFPDALRSLADDLGIQIPERSGRREEKSPYEDLYETNRLALDFFRGILQRDPQGEAALAYLHGRRITDEAVEAFSIGFAPDGWDGLLDRARKEKVAHDRLVRCGLAVEGNRGLHDYFRRRIIFPIRDNRGRLAGFAGREFGGGQPKYLNSPDTPIFMKRKILYGYHAARSHIRGAGEVLIVEGYTDLIALVQAGVRNVVAPMGTALTEEQAVLLSRNAKTAVLVYDRDEAGLKATFRAGDLFLKTGIGVRAVQLPEGEDPDSFVGRSGIEAFSTAVAEGVDLLELKIRVLEGRGFFDSVDGRRAATDHLLRTVSVTRDDVIRDIYLGRSAEALHVDKSVLASRMQGGRSAPVRRTRSTERPETLGKLEGVVERYLIQLMLMGEGFTARIRQSLGPDDFAHPGYRRAFLEISKLHEAGESMTADGVAGGVPEDLRPLVSELCLTTEEVTDPDKILQDCLRKIESRKVEEEMHEIEARISRPGSDDDRLAGRYYHLKKRLLTLRSEPVAPGRDG